MTGLEYISIGEPMRLNTSFSRFMGFRYSFKDMHSSPHVLFV